MNKLISQRHEHILTELPVCIVIMNERNIISFCNDFFSAIFGSSASDAIGKNFFDFIPEIEKDKIEYFYSNLNKDQTNYNTYHYNLDYSNKIKHHIYLAENKITIILEKEIISKSDQFFKNANKPVALKKKLNDIVRGFTKVLSIDPIQAIEETLATACQLSDSDDAYILKLNPLLGLYQVDTTWSSRFITNTEDLIRAFSLKIPKTFEKELLSENLIHLTQAELLDESHPFNPIFLQLKAKELVVTPLKAKDGLAGVICFTKVKAQTRFSEVELSPLKIGSEIISKSFLAITVARELKKTTLGNLKTIKNLTIGVIYQDEFGKIISINNAALKLLGLKKSEINSWEILKPNWKAFDELGQETSFFKSTSQSSLNTRTTIQNKVLRIFRPSTADSIWLSIDVIPELDSSENKISRILTSFKDISLRVAAEKQSENDHKLLEAIIEHSHSAIYVKDLESRYTMVNRRWEMVTGQSRSKVFNKRLEEFFEPKMTDKYFQEDLQVLGEGKTIFAEEKLEKAQKNGSIITQYFLSIKFPYRNNLGEIIGMCGISTDVTAVKEATMMVIERESNLHGILESVSERVWSVDKNLNIVYTNTIFFNDFFNAYGVALIKGLNIIKSIPDLKEREKWEKRYKQVIKKKEPLQFISKIKAPNKSYFLDVVMYPILVHDQVEGISVFSKDITEKIEFEKSSAMYKSLFDSSKNGVYLIYPKSLTIKEANQSATNNTQYNRDEMFGMPITNLIAPEDKEVILEKILSIASKRTTTAFLEFNCMRKDGTTFPATALIQLFFYEEESYVSIFISDVSERKKTQLALKESELRFAQIFNENVSPMILVDPTQGNLVDANPSAALYYGYDLSTLKGKNILDLNFTYESQPSEMNEALDEVMSSGKGKFLFEHKLKSGEKRTVEVFCSKITVDNKDLVHEIIQDVTDRNNYFNALAKQNEALKEIAQIQSHVVRAPLANIMGLIYLLKEEKASGNEDSFDETLQAILGAADKLDSVILEISKKSNDAKHLLN
jgi:PAS domain S-box-containing protein